MKNTDARFKLSSEVHKHHTYYSLTKSGEHLLRYLKENDLVDAYVEAIRGDDLGLRLIRLADELNSDHALTYAKLAKRGIEEVGAKLEELVRMGLLEEVNSKVIKFGDRKSKPKRETRTHHKYYGLSRMGVIAVRELKRKGVIPR